MLILGLDTETTGLDCTKDKIIELGAVLWDTETKAPIEIYSTLVIQDNMGDELPAEIIEITGITLQMILQHGEPAPSVFAKLQELEKKAEYVLAHNAPFDKSFYDEQYKKLNYQTTYQRPWIDTQRDLPLPAKITTRKLTYLAAEHGFINPFAHRALFDVLTMLKLISCYNFATIVKLSKEPNITIRAIVCPPWEDEGKQTGLAKELGYRWEGTRKLWVKEVKQSQATEVINQAIKNGIKAVILA